MNRARVLVSEVAGGIPEALRAGLSSWGYTVTEYSDGLGVLDQFLTEQVIAIILDQETPGGDKRSIARMIRYECDAPIVFLSIHDREESPPIPFDTPDVYCPEKPPMTGSSPTCWRTLSDRGAL